MDFDPADWFALSGVFVALVATGAAWKAARATEKATEVQLVNDLLREYSSEQFGGALQLIREWIDQTPGQSADQAAEHLRKDLQDRPAGQGLNETSGKTDLARRRISHYFLRAWRLYGSQVSVRNESSNRDDSHPGSASTSIRERSSFSSPTLGVDLGGKPSEPSKEYRARIWVKLSDDFLPHPLLSKAELEVRLTEALGIGTDDSAIVSVRVDDPR